MALTGQLTTVQAGATYKFRVQAHNIHGWGPTSPELSVITSGVPTKPAAIVVSIENLEVKLKWVKPSENFNAITKYEILIL
jgi:hypothetical protein